MASAFHFNDSPNVVDEIILDGEAAHEQRVWLGRTALERFDGLAAAADIINNAICSAVERKSSISDARVQGDEALGRAIGELYSMLGFHVVVRYDAGAIDVHLDATEERPIALTLGEIDNFERAMAELHG